VTRRLAGIAVLAAMALVLSACASRLGYSGYGNYKAPAAGPSASPTPPIARASLRARAASYLGVYDSEAVKSSYHRVNEFATAVGVQPNIVLYYTTWGGGLQIPLANMTSRHHATLAMDLDPTGISVRSIVRGKWDKYLRHFAFTVRAFAHPVIISFGHEMNGNWYPWGYTHVAPALWVKAWRHIVTVFRHYGADNVTWMWTVNAIIQNQGLPISDWWPGAKYVTWVGIDAYYYQAAQDFSTTFEPTISAIRQITKKPIMIAETAVGPVAGQSAKIPGLFAGVRADHLLGLIWFDMSQSNGQYHQDWRLEGNPAGTAAFRQAVKQYIKLLPATG